MVWSLWQKLRTLCAATGILKVEMRPGAERKYDLWQEEGFFCPGRAARAAPGRSGQEGCCGTSKKHFIFAAEKMKNSLLTL